MSKLRARTRSRNVLFSRPLLEGPHAGLGASSLNEISSQVRRENGDEKEETFVYLDPETGAVGELDRRYRRHGERVRGHYCRPDVHQQDREEPGGIVRDSSVDASQTRQQPNRNTDDGRRPESRPVCGGVDEQRVRLQRSVGSARGSGRPRGHAENVRPKPTCPGTVAVQLSSGQAAGVGVGGRVFRPFAAGRHRGSHENGAGMRRHRGRSGSRGGRSPYQPDGGAEWRFQVLSLTVLMRCFMPVLFLWPQTRPSTC